MTKNPERVVVFFLDKRQRKQFLQNSVVLAILLYIKCIMFFQLCMYCVVSHFACIVLFWAIFVIFNLKGK